MEALLIGIAASFNFYIIYTKVEHDRYLDAALDVLALTLLSMMFGQSTGGMVIATIGSAIISVFLLFKKPKIMIDDTKLQWHLSEFKNRLPK